MHGSDKPREGVSTLLNETGNIQLYRVSEETRKKVAEETDRIQRDMIRHKRNKVKQFEKEDLERLKRNEKSRKNMISHWSHKTRNSPFRELLANSEEKRAERLEKFELELAQDETKRKIIENMTGKPGFEICPKTRIPTFSNFEHQIALEYRLQARDAKVIKQEKQFVDGMVSREISTTRTKFPKISAQLSCVVAKYDGNSNRKNSSYQRNRRPDSDGVEDLRDYYNDIFEFPNSPGKSKDGGGVSGGGKGISSGGDNDNGAYNYLEVDHRKDDYGYSYDEDEEDEEDDGGGGGSGGGRPLTSLKMNAQEFDLDLNTSFLPTSHSNSNSPKMRTIKP